MPNLAAVLKAEISRLARRELRGELEAMRKTIAAQRSDIAALKRQAQALEQSSRKLAKALPANGARGAGTTPTKPQAPAPSGRGTTFSAQDLADHRAQLGISAAQYGLLVGTTGQSVYAWEQAAAYRGRRTWPRSPNYADSASAPSLQSWRPYRKRDCVVPQRSVKLCA